MAYRLLHLIDSCQRRGAEVFASQLATCMEQGGRFLNGLCSLHDDGDDPLPTGRLPVFKLQAHKGFFEARSGLDPLLLLRLYRSLHRFRPDIVVAHGGDTLKYAAIARTLGWSRLAIYRNIGYASFWNRSSLQVRLNRTFLQRVGTAVSVSRYTREDFIYLYRLPPERVVFIPNGVDVSPFCYASRDGVRAQVRQELGVPQEATLLITVGNLSGEKGHKGLLEVVAGLTDDIPGQLHLVMVGDGPLRRELEQQANGLGIARRAHFLGRREDVPRLMAAADLFVLPSKTEGMPAVLIEAGLAGLPSVSFNVGGVAEVIEHGATGLLVLPEDYPEMASAIAALAQDPQRRETMGAAARQFCLEHFDIHKVARQYEALFLGLLSRIPEREHGGA